MTLRHRILHALAAEPCSTSGDLADELHAAVEPVSTALRMLVLARLADRRACLRRGCRIYVYWLTDEGHARAAGVVGEGA